MEKKINGLALVALVSTLLVACGGSDGSDYIGFEGDGETAGSEGGSNDGGDSGDDDDEVTAEGVSYLPLMLFEAYKEFSIFDVDGLFLFDRSDSYVYSYLINPVDAGTLQPIDQAVTGDYSVTIDDIQIDPFESHPLLQKVIGNTPQLKTALVFDVSSSIAGENVDLQALVNEAKAYVDAAQASGNALISNQEFVVWAFAKQVEDLSGGFTANNTAIDAALDLVVSRYSSKVLGTTSNLHKAIVQVVGRYTEDPYDFNTDGDNDLEDLINLDQLQVTQLVIFSNGPDSYREMEAELMEKAIDSQSFLKYDEQAGAAANQTVMLPKPVFYYVVGGEVSAPAYQGLSNKAEVTRFLVLSGGRYSFSSTLIADQVAAVDSRINLDNQYVYRFAYVPRNGDHTTIFSSNASGFNYSLTSEETDDELSAVTVGSPEEEKDSYSLVEIAGPNGEYISGGTISLSEANRFTPATRWTNDSFAAPDYQWNISVGSGTITRNTDGSVTVDSIAGGAITLQLTNNVLDAVLKTATIIVTND